MTEEAKDDDARIRWEEDGGANAWHGLVVHESRATDAAAAMVIFIGHI